MSKILSIFIAIIICSGILLADSYSLQFDGIDDYVNCGNDSSLTEFDRFTMEARVWLEDTNNDQKIFGKFKDWDNFYVFGVGGGCLYFQMEANAQLIGFFAGSIPSQEWVHLAVTFSKGNGGNNGTCYGYVNGEQVYIKEDVSDNPLSVSEPAFPFRIGVAPWDTNAFHVIGYIDEIRIWNISRSITDIQYLMEAYLAGNEPGLAAYYSMSDGTGTSLTDDSVNSNTGTLYDGVTIGNGPDWSVDSYRPAGDGTQWYHYQISELKHLSWMSKTTSLSNLYRHFIQTADIDASYTSVWNNNSAFIPIGTETHNFRGKYNGQGFTIDGLTIQRDNENNIGFIGYAGSVDIMNLGLTNVNIDGKHSLKIKLDISCDT